MRKDRSDQRGYFVPIKHDIHYKIYGSALGHG
jgi:hypothetical protein